MGAHFGRAKAACLCSYFCSRHVWCYDGGRLGRVKIVTLRVGARAKEGKGGGGGRKKIRTPPQYHCSLGNSVRLIAIGAPDWCDLVEIDWCLSINCKSILFIPFSFARNCFSLRGKRKKGRGGGGRKARKRGKGKRAPAIRAVVFVFRPPFSQLIR